MEEEIADCRQADGSKFSKLLPEAIDKFGKIVQDLNYEPDYLKCENIDFDNIKNSQCNTLSFKQIDERKKEMRQPSNNAESFMGDKFTQNGIQNIYGMPEKEAEMEFKLIGTTVKTYIIRD